MKSRTTLRNALGDPKLLGNVLKGDSWRAWRVLLIAAMGETLSDDERALFKQLTQRDHEPRQRIDELVAIVGRRGGKSRAISVIATYIAGLCTHPALVPGERGILLILAPDKKQSAVVLNYVEAAFRTSPILRQLIESRTANVLRLTNRIDVEVRASDFRTIRGPTYIAVIADEAAFWMVNEESANPDAEILNACRPGLATTGGPLFVISSPYARRGELYNLYAKNFGPQGDSLILVAQGASRTFNPTLPQSVVDRAIERDPAAASAEYLGQFRTDVEAFVSRDIVDAAIIPGRRELTRLDHTRYTAFCDPSGGGDDGYALAICHIEGNRIVLDLVRNHTRVSPDKVTEEYATLIKAYGLTVTRGDNYAGQWPRQAFAEHGIDYQRADKTKSDLFRDFLPLLNSGRVELLDHTRLVTQLSSLERSVGRSGRDTIGHPPGGHDDIANAVAGAVVTASRANARKVPMVAAPDLSKSSQENVAPNLRGVPSQYLKSATEPWRKFVSGNAGDRWGPT